MTIEISEPRQRKIYPTFYTPPPPEFEVEGSVLGASFRLENDVVNFIQMLQETQLDLEEDPNFDVRSLAEHPMMLRYPDVLATAKSQKEFDFLNQKLREEDMDRMIRAQAGWRGVLADMVAGVASPTIFLPAGAGARAVSVGRAFFEAAAWGTIAVGVQEGILQSNQKLRTWDESLINVLAGAAVGGVLGAGIRKLDPLGYEAAARRMADVMVKGDASDLKIATEVYGLAPERNLAPAAPASANAPTAVPTSIRVSRDQVRNRLAATLPRGTEIDDETVELFARQEEAAAAGQTADLMMAPEVASEGPRDLSAAAAPQFPLFPDPGKPVNMETVIGRVAGMSFINPLTRQMVIEDPLLRSYMYQMGNAGLVTRNNTEGVSTLHGGDIEGRKAQHQAVLATGILGTKKHYIAWSKRTKDVGSIRAMLPFNSAKQHFQHLVTQGVELQAFGRMHEDPDVAAAAAIYVEQFYKIIQEAGSVRMSGFENLSDKMLLRLAVQHIRKDVASSEGRVLHEIYRQHILEVLSDAKFMRSEPVKKMLAAVADEETGMVQNIRELADLLATKIMRKHQSNILRHGTVDSMTELKILPEFLVIDPNRKWTIYGRARTSAVTKEPEGLGAIDLRVNDENLLPQEVQFRAFLEPDIEIIMRSYLRSMAGNVELQRVFGTVDPMNYEDKNNPVWSRLQEKQDREKVDIDDALEKKILALQADTSKTEAARLSKINKARAEAAKQREKIDQKYKDFDRDFGITVGRVKSTWGAPADPYSWTFRLGRAALNVNTVRLMGMVMVSSVADLARMVFKHGFVSTLRDGLIPMLTDFRTYKMTRQEILYSGAVMDVIMHGRSNAIFDVTEDTAYGNAAERGLQAMTNNIGIIAGFDYWNQETKMLVGQLLIADVSRTLSAVGHGKATGQQLGMLSSLGLSKVNAKRLWKRYQEGGATEVRKGVWLPNTEDWTQVRIPGSSRTMDLYDNELFRKLRVEDVMPEGLSEVEISEFKKDFKSAVRYAEDGRELQLMLRSALFRGITNTIIQPGLEKPAWLDGSTGGRIIGQFRSFGFSSQLKTLVAASQQLVPSVGGVKGMSNTANGVAFSLALGAFSYYLWAQSFGPESQIRQRMLNEFDAAINGDTEALARIADEAIARSGLSGAYEEVRRVAERIPHVQDYATLANTPTTRSPFVEPFTELLGPTRDLTKQFDRILQSGPDPNSAQFIDAAQKLMPYQNVFWLRAILDAGVENLKESVNAR